MPEGNLRKKMLSIDGAKGAQMDIFDLYLFVTVVYLDADTVMMKNSYVLFSCPGFCATMRDSERLNSGMVVVTPSKELYDDMMSKIEGYPSYSG